MSPRLSVCMATYNGGRWVREQLASILRQLGPDDEVVVSDDASTDDTLAVIAGGRSPRVKLPHWVPMTVAAVDTFAAGLTGRQPRFPLDGMKLSRYKMFFDPAKAVRELGLPQTPIEEPLRRAVTWFRDNGYVRDQAAISNMSGAA